MDSDCETFGKTEAKTKIRKGYRGNFSGMVAGQETIFLDNSKGQSENDSYRYDLRISKGKNGQEDGWRKRKEVMGRLQESK